MWPKPGSARTAGRMAPSSPSSRCATSLGAPVVPDVGSTHWLAKRGKRSLFIGRDGIAAKIDRALRAEILVRRVADDGVDFGLGYDAGEPTRRKIGWTDHQPRREAVEFDQRARRRRIATGRRSAPIFPPARDRRLANIVDAPMSRPRKVGVRRVHDAKPVG